MTRPSRRQERIDQLAALMQPQGRVRLRDAARLLDVSEMTLRRDAEDSATPFTCLGGYLVDQRLSRGDYVFEREKLHHTEAKIAACRAAAASVRPGEVVFVDCGTTTPHLAAALPSDQGLTVLCYSLNVAGILARRGLDMVMLGGTYHRNNDSFYSESSLRMLRRYRLDRAFLSAGGWDRETGASCSHYEEVAIKQTAIERAAIKALVIDSSKFGKTRPAHFAAPQQIGAVFSDKPAPDWSPGA